MNDELSLSSSLSSSALSARVYRLLCSPSPNSSEIDWRKNKTKTTNSDTVNRDDTVESRLPSSTQNLLETHSSSAIEINPPREKTSSRGALDIDWTEITIAKLTKQQSNTFIFINTSIEGIYIYIYISVYISVYICLLSHIFTYCTICLFYLFIYFSFSLIRYSIFNCG